MISSNILPAPLWISLFLGPLHVYVGSYTYGIYTYTYVGCFTKSLGLCSLFFPFFFLSASSDSVTFSLSYFRFADSSTCSNLLLKLSSEFFILFVVLCSRISFWFLIIVSTSLLIFLSCLYIILLVCFCSLSVFSCRPLRMFKTVILMFLSSKSEVWTFTRWFLPMILFPWMGHALLFLCMPFVVAAATMTFE